MSDNQWPLVGEAIKRRDAEAVRRELNAGESVERRLLEGRRKGRGWYLLEYAVYRDAGAVVTVLLQAGADPERPFENGGRQFTAMEYAEARGKKAALGALRAHREANGPAAKGGKADAPNPGGGPSPPVAAPRPAIRSDASLRRKNANAALKYEDLELREEIGKGAYGCVWRGTYLGRNVACKIVSMAGADEKEQENLRREIQLHHKAKHPNIVEMIGLSRDPEKNLVIVLEYVEGGDLLSVLTRKELDLPWVVRVRIAKQVASALGFLHSHNVLHRDLKSENLLLDADNNIRLCDFGFARSVDNGGGRGRASTVCGTPYYSAPEVLLGRPYDHSADVYAYGCLVVELITRRTVNVDRIAQRDAEQPCGVDTVGLVKKIPRSIGFPPPFLKLGLVCLEYKPEKRPTMKQAEQMAGAIEKKL